PRVGDINQDGLVDIADVSDLMTALKDKTAYLGLHPLFTASDATFNLDVNLDGSADNRDLQAEIVLLANGGGGGSLAAVPEPATFCLMILGGLALAGGRIRRSRTRR